MNRVRPVCFSRLFLFTSLVWLASCGGGSSSSSASRPEPAGTLGAAVDDVVNASMKQQGIPGMTVALAKNGSMLYVKAYGVADKSRHTGAQPTTIFQVGSITKQFTAALIMKLHEQGKLSVDDPIRKYLPEYGFSSLISLRMCLTHTSGLANFTAFSQYPGWAVNGVSETTVLTAISQAASLFQPGTAWSYSNSNYFVLGAIIERVSGQPYASNLAQYIFQPLALTSTSFALPAATQSAIGYTQGGARAVVVDRSAPFAAGAMSSNAYDLVAWYTALINGRVVSPASCIEMTTSEPLSVSAGGAYGFGLGLSTFNGRRVVGHGGSIDGFTADTAVILDDGFALVVLTNSDRADPHAISLQIMNVVCNADAFKSNC
jgi:D-alanyl-D-alanine carboxypeptidase